MNNANNMIALADIEIKAGKDVRESTLIEYYELMYPERVAFFMSSWKWLYTGVSADCKLPIVLVSGDKVIGHGGMIPVTLSVRSRSFKAGWFVDLSVLPEFQRKGLGTVLVNKRMELTDIQMTFPNEKSYGVFKKKGWSEYHETYLHYVFIFPFNHQRFITKVPGYLRFIFNSLYFPFFLVTLLGKTHGNPIDYLLGVNEKSIKSFFDNYQLHRNCNKDIITIDRNMDFVKWRIINSPNRDFYKIYTNNDFCGIVSFNKNSRVIDILWVTDIENKKEIRKMISILAKYGRKLKFTYIRFFTTKRDLSSYLRHSILAFVTHPRFVYNIKMNDKSINMAGLRWEVELIDSDFEFHR
jgi:GNAT superfamily N-acetyltransferase